MSKYFLVGLVLLVTACHHTRPDSELRFYQVVTGDTLYSIAEAHKMAVNYLANCNNLVAPYSLTVGQWLKTNCFATTRKEPSNSCKHVVEEGDTLSLISRKCGCSINSIIDLNNIKNPNQILVGDTLSIC
ncbi:LysM peptidoglycan-binding domain-containing protein [Candidatus Halobeggiatoa sp. HSG11]|nr:LysM peptidoglycan-binding domain-containing protein [Candidatus Halobeggiatoa sp. HSG11]